MSTLFIFQTKIKNKLNLGYSKYTTGTTRNFHASTVKFSKIDFSYYLYRHPFHIVDNSPWPFFSAFSMLVVTLNLVASFLGFSSPLLFAISFFIIIYCVTCWLSDVITEGTFEGFHTFAVRENLKLGWILFILSEIMFFSSLFWAFFHSALSPTIFIGAIWPPLGTTPPSPWGIALLNTLLLLTSGASLTCSYFALRYGDKKRSIFNLIITLFLGLLFTVAQLIEYKITPLHINDGIFGTCFYVTTGFHGLHVLIGSIFLLVCLFRLWNSHFTNTHHVGFICANWYWHFVDIVWIAVYFFFYHWSQSGLVS